MNLRFDVPTFYERNNNDDDKDTDDDASDATSSLRMQMLFSSSDEPVLLPSTYWTLHILLAHLGTTSLTHIRLPDAIKSVTIVDKEI